MTEETGIKVSMVHTDGGTQARAGLHEHTVQEYKETMTAAGGWPFPPIVLVYDGDKHWLADGFHRVAAARALGWSHVLATIQPGTRRDAILVAAGANADHGLRRSNDDKRRAVQMLLQDEEWGRWSDREIARRCKVSHPMVAKLRAELAEDTGNITSERVYVDRHGNETVMETAKIGTATAVSKADEEAPACPLSRCPRESCREDFQSRQSRGAVYKGKYAGSKLDYWRCTNCGREFDETGKLPRTKAERQSALNMAAYDWLKEYEDDKGRTWRDLEGTQVHHANSPCFQAFVAAFPDSRDLERKFALKQAIARLRREQAAFSEHGPPEVEAITAAELKEERQPEMSMEHRRALWQQKAQAWPLICRLYVKTCDYVPVDEAQQQADFKTVAHLHQVMGGRYVDMARALHTFNFDVIDVTTQARAARANVTRWLRQITPDSETEEEVLRIVFNWLVDNHAYEKHKGVLEFIVNEETGWGVEWNSLLAYAHNFDDRDRGDRLAVWLLQALHQMIDDVKKRTASDKEIGVDAVGNIPDPQPEPPIHYAPVSALANMVRNWLIKTGRSAAQLRADGRISQSMWHLDQHLTEINTRWRDDDLWQAIEQVAGEEEEAAPADEQPETLVERIRAALHAADKLIPATKDETIIYQCTQAALHLDKAMQRAQALEE
jgi:hypothetical protein